MRVFPTRPARFQILQSNTTLLKESLEAILLLVFLQITIATQSPVNEASFCWPLLQHLYTSVPGAQTHALRLSVQLLLAS